MVESGSYSKEQVDILRRTPIEEVLRSRGHDVRHTRSGLYHSPFRGDKTPSFHIDTSRNVWSDPGDHDPAHLKRNRDGSPKKQAGGDVVDLVMFLDGCTFRKALDYLASFNPGVTPEVRAAVRPAARVAADGALAGYVNHSGGAVGADAYWGEAGARFGVASRHYWHGKRTPSGNVEVSGEDFLEGTGMVLRANRRLRRQPERYMDLLARDWAQVKYADAVFAVGSFCRDAIRVGPSGVLGYRPVDGGTGWAVQMAIDAGKPVHLFDQASGKWYRFVGPDRELSGWKELAGAPVLTRNFAGIGSRALTEAGRLAIRNAYSATLRQVKGLSSAPAAEERRDGFMAGVDMTRRVNIWAGSGENASLSNFAPRPFNVGLVQYSCVEQYLQHAKALFAGDSEVAALILAATDPKEMKSLGRQVRGLDVPAWDAAAPEVMERGIRLSFSANPSAKAELLRTGSALLTHAQESGRWRDEFPRILMRLRAGFQGEIVDDNGLYQGASTIEVRSFRRGPRMESLRDYFVNVRGIFPEVLSRYAFEVHYDVLHDGKPREGARQYAAVGFPNASGHWALRGAPYRERGGAMNGGVKRSTGGDFSVIGRDGSLMFREGVDGIVPGAPRLAKTSDCVVVFEGFTDFLSWLCWFGKEVPGNADAVVLNSTSQVPAAMDYIVSHKDVVAYLDNDEAGRARTEQIRERCGAAGGRFIDASSAYAGCNDLNERWVKEKAEREERARREAQAAAAGESAKAGNSTSYKHP